MQLVYARTDGGTAALAASRHACFVSHSLRHSHRGCRFRGLAAARVPRGSLIPPLRAGLACTCAMGLGRLTPTITQTDHGHTAHSSRARRGRSSQPSGLGRGSGARLEAKRYKSKKPWRSFLIAHIPVRVQKSFALIAIGVRREDPGARHISYTPLSLPLHAA